MQFAMQLSFANVSHSGLKPYVLSFYCTIKLTKTPAQTAAANLVFDSKHLNF